MHGIPILINFNTLPIHLQKQIEYFEKEDQGRPTYELEPWQKRYIDNFLNYAKPKEYGIIVDNATGSGYMAIELAKKGFRVIATDLTLAELIKLQHIVTKLKLESNVLLLCCTSEALPIKSRSVNGLVANAILEHLPKEQEAIAEIARVVKNGAPVMVAMPIDLLYVWPFLWSVNIAHDRKIGHLRRYTRSQILKKFSKFSEITTYYTGSFMKIICIIMKIMTKDARWARIGEQLDERFRSTAYGSSNVVSIIRKRI